jgi:hypothetical protein
MLMCMFRRLMDARLMRLTYIYVLMHRRLLAKGRRYVAVIAFYVLVHEV